MTTELKHNIFLFKLECVGEALEIIKPHLPDLRLVRSSYILKTYENLRENYEVEVVESLSQYYSDSDLNAYDMYLTSHFDKLQQCINFIETVHESGVVGLGDLVMKLRKKKINTRVQKETYDVCDCGSKMRLFPITSEIVCLSCGLINILPGTIFEDNEYEPMNKNSYDPQKHCKLWIQKIQADESTEIPQACIDDLIKCIKRDGITDCRRLLCGQLRLYLKETRMTEYNDHVPLIRKMITGIVPPQLTDEELRCLYNLFDKSTVSHEKSNTMYYPYIIYKILDLIIVEGLRKKQILECIHLQSRDTLIANDNMWEDICLVLQNTHKLIRYKPTDRNEQNIDF